MKVYRPENSWEDQYRINVPTMTVQEQIAESRFSGLYDAEGNKLMVIEQKDPIGFLRFPAK